MKAGYLTANADMFAKNALEITAKKQKISILCRQTMQFHMKTKNTMCFVSLNVITELLRKCMGKQNLLFERKKELLRKRYG